MRRSTTPSKTPLVWSSLGEHLVKTGLYALFVAHAVRSALRSSTTFSYVANSLVALLFLWTTKGEVDLAIQRVRRALPPGYLGFPILREIDFFRALVGGGVRERLEAARRRYGTVFAQSAFGQVTVVLGGRADLSFLFDGDRRAHTEVDWPPNVRMLLGPGAVANQTGRRHRALRRLLEPYFAPRFVANYLGVMDRTTVEELESWSATGEFLSSEVFKMYALKLFYASSFGRVDEDVIATLHDDFKIWIGGFMPWNIWGAMKARDRILDTVEKLMGQFEEENPEGSERAQTTIIGRLIYGKDKDGNPMMTRDEIKDNVLNLIFAGHDTTYASISTLIYHLSQNPGAMEALAEESSTLSEQLGCDELKNAPVLNACMHESWRMDPPVAFGFRKAVREVSHGGYSFARGTVFNYSMLLPAADEGLYRDCGRFDMRRFLPKSHPLYEAEIDSGVDPLQGRANYPIFGGGTHVCLGKAFAQLELRVVAARMTKHYQIEVRNPQKQFLPVNGWNVEFKLTKRMDT